MKADSKQFRLPPQTTPGGFVLQTSFRRTLRSVKDVAGNVRSSGTIGTLGVNFAFAWVAPGNVLKVDFDGTSRAIGLSTSGTDIVASRNAQTIPFAGVNGIVATGTPNDDALEIAGPVSPTLQFSSGNGHDSLKLVSGNYPIPINLDDYTTIIDSNTPLIGPPL